MPALAPWLFAAAGSALAVALERRRRADARTIATLSAGNRALSAELALAARGHRHSVSGLPTREPLLAAIAAAETGTLGLISLVDFDRLATFDPVLADRVLVALVERLRHMVADRRLLAHVDRGQFAIWIGGEVTPEAAHAEITGLASSLSDTIADGTRDIVPRIDWAHARWPDDDADPPGLLARASSVLATGAQAAGAAREGSVADLAAQARDRYLGEQDLREAVEAAAFHLAFQPLVDAEAGEVIGAEALVRWQHPRRGAVPPGAFVPLIESMGLADRLGGWALDAAAAAASRWPQPWRVAVNMSARQLEHGDLAHLVERTLATHRLAPQRLEMELTETVATADPARAAVLFDRLRTLGVGVAIDDFGTGFSSFSAVRRLRFDKIKIDREFVTDVHRRRDSQAICQSIIALARGLGAELLAEGVETRDEYRWLRGQGCRLFQGYWFAEPLDPAAFVAFATDRARFAERLAEG